MSDVVPIRRVADDELHALIAADVGHRVPVSGHEGHLLIEKRYDAGRDGYTVYARCSCGHWLGGARLPTP